jgi:hypothetical protein
VIEWESESVYSESGTASNCFGVERKVMVKGDEDKTCAKRTGDSDME